MAKKIELTRGKVALVSDKDYKWLSQWKWGCIGRGYAGRFVRIDGRRFLIYMHRLILNPPDGMEVDHVNRNKLDNRRRNLRAATRRQNDCNRAAWKTCGYRGVALTPRKTPWAARIRVNGKLTHLGSFHSAEEAARAYDAAAILHHGEFAVLNFKT
jgi:hypothetical protein